MTLRLGGMGGPLGLTAPLSLNGIGGAGGGNSDQAIISEFNQMVKDINNRPAGGPSSESGGRWRFQNEQEKQKFMKLMTYIVAHDLGDEASAAFGTIEHEPGENIDLHHAVELIRQQEYKWDAKVDASGNPIEGKKHTAQEESEINLMEALMGQASPETPVFSMSDSDYGQELSLAQRMAKLQGTPIGNLIQQFKNNPAMTPDQAPGFGVGGAAQTLSPGELPIQQLAMGLLGMALVLMQNR